MSQMYVDLKGVETSLFKNDQVVHFLQTYSEDKILDELLNGKPAQPQYELLIKFLNFILERESNAEKFIFNPTLFKQIELLVKNRRDETRNVVSQCLFKHPRQFYKFIHKEFLAVPESVDRWLQIVFELLHDEDTGIGIRAVQTLTRLVRESQGDSIWIMDAKALSASLEAAIQSSNDVVRIRAMDLVIELSNLQEAVQKRLQDSGVFTKAVNIYKTADLLTKLAAVEVIQKLGDSAWNSKFLSESALIKSMIKDAFDEMSEYYVKKNLTALLAKLFARGTIAFTETVRKNFTAELERYLTSSYKEENEGALEIIGCLGISMAGVRYLIDRSGTLLHALVRFGDTSNDSIRKKYVNAFSCLVTKAPEVMATMTKEDMNNIAYIVSIFGIYPHQFAKYNGDLEYDKLLSGGFIYLINQLFLPFQDLELIALQLLTGCLRYEFCIREFAKQAKSLEYLVKYPAKSKEIFDLKMAIRDDLANAPYTFRTESWFSKYVTELKTMIDATKIETMLVGTESAQ